MTREQFIKKFFNVEGFNESSEMWKGISRASSIFGIEYALIGAVYDLQQQITQKDEFIDYLDQRLINLEQEVYK